MIDIKKHLISLALLLGVGTSLHAQMESAHWYFGSNAGLNFLDRQAVTSTKGIVVEGIPKTETGPISTMEGCFSLSDSQGNLIVASDGMKVYNKNKTLIAQGLYGNTSSAQSGILIPYPGKPDNYIIISNKQAGGSNGGLYYSIFDAKANGGNGAVTNINTLIKQTTVPYTNMYENVTSQIHANGYDYWILHRTGPHFFTWLVTSDGISNTPIVTNIGGLSLSTGMSEGYMKVSPDGSKVVHCNLDAPNGEFMIADFDNKEGTVKNIIFRYMKYTSNYGFYGLEFSPQGKNLFLTELNGGVHVVAMDDVATKTPTLLTMDLAALQTGYDGRIYGIKKATYNFGVIPNPDDPIDQLEVHVFNNYLNGRGEWGLPSFAANWFAIKGDDAVCMDKEAEFSTSISGGNVAYIKWNFGDNTQIIKQNTSTGVSTYSQKHKFSTPGKYIVKICFYNIQDELQRELTTDISISSCMLPVNPNIH